MTKYQVKINGTPIIVNAEDSSHAKNLASQELGWRDYGDMQYEAAKRQLMLEVEVEASKQGGQP